MKKIMMIFIPLCYGVAMQADMSTALQPFIKDSLGKAFAPSKGGAVVPAGSVAPSSPAKAPAASLGSLLGGGTKSTLGLDLDLAFTEMNTHQTGFGKLNEDITNIEGTTQIIYGDYEGSASSSMAGGASKGLSTKAGSK